MSHIFGIPSDIALPSAIVALLVLWYVARSPKIKHGADVLMKVYCLRCNWEGRVKRCAAACGQCHSRQLSVLTL